MLCLKENKLILVFPGMGKTPLSLVNPKYKDVDFGTFRKGLGYSKAEDNKLCPIFTNYLMALDEDWDNTIIMSNEPKLMKYIKVNRVFVPRGISIDYCAKKMHVTPQQIISWVNGWVQLARQYHVPVTWLDIGFDKHVNTIKARVM